MQNDFSLLNNWPDVCPKGSLASAKSEPRSDAEELDEYVKNVIRKVESKFNVQALSMPQIAQFMDAVICGEYLGYEPLLSRDDPLYQEILIAGTYYGALQPQKTSTESKMPATYFFKELKSYLHRKMEGKLSKKMLAFGAHDVNIGIVLSALDFS
jgi:hypothetical protein